MEHVDALDEINLTYSSESPLGSTLSTCQVRTLLQLCCEPTDLEELVKDCKQVRMREYTLNVAKKTRWSSVFHKGFCDARKACSHSIR